MTDEDLARGRPVVLAADDEPAIRRLYSRVLSTAGFEVVEAGDGEDVLVLLATIEASLVLLDTSMPRLDGLAVLRRLRADEATAHLPVILVTGAGAEADRVQGLDLGADDYLIKPFSIEELIARVHAHVRIPYRRLDRD